MAGVGAGAVGTGVARGRPSLAAGLALGVALLLLCAFASLSAGASAVNPGAVYAALVAPDGSNAQVIVRTIRLPRTLIALSVGAALAVAGALMQGLTRNPLASPGLLGVNAGAALAVVLAVFLFGVGSVTLLTWCAFLGAGLAAAAVALLGALGRGGATPLKLAVAGAALTAFLSSLTTAVLVLNERTFDEVRFWLAGSVAGRDLGLFLRVAPYLALGLAVAFLLARRITTLTLGEEVARGLGQRTARVKLAAAGCVVLLAGGSVAVAGPIGFVGLVVPHLVRPFVGTDYRWLLPYAAVTGAALLTLADIGARLVLRPVELPVGVMTAILGGPFFVFLVGWKVRR